MSKITLTVLIVLICVSMSKSSMDCLTSECLNNYSSSTVESNIALQQTQILQTDTSLDDTIRSYDWLNDLVLSYCTVLLYTMIGLAMSLKQYLGSGDSMIDEPSITKTPTIMEKDEVCHDVSYEQEEPQEAEVEEVEQQEEQEETLSLLDVSIIDSEDQQLEQVEQVEEQAEQKVEQVEQQEEEEQVEVQQEETFSLLDMSIIEQNTINPEESWDIETPRKDLIESDLSKQEFSPNSDMTESPRSQSTDLDCSNISLISLNEEDSPNILYLSDNDSYLEINEHEVSCIQPFLDESMATESTQQLTFETSLSQILNNSIPNSFMDDIQLGLQQIQAVKDLHEQQVNEHARRMFRYRMELYEIRLQNMVSEANSIDLQLQKMAEVNIVNK